MTEKKAKEYTEDFYNNFGIELNTVLDGESPHKIIAWCNRIEMIIYEEIKERCPTFRWTNLTQSQLDAIWRAMLEQGYYILSNYDMNIFSGIDPVSSTVIPLDEIRKRSFSPLAYKILKNVGLFYAGIKPVITKDEPFRTFWRD